MRRRGPRLRGCRTRRVRGSRREARGCRRRRRLPMRRARVRGRRRQCRRRSRCRPMRRRLPSRYRWRKGRSCRFPFFQKPRFPRSGVGGETSLEGPQIEAARTRRAATQWRTREAGCGLPLRTWNGLPPKPLWGKQTTPPPARAATTAGAKRRLCVRDRHPKGEDRAAGFVEPCAACRARRNRARRPAPGPGGRPYPSAVVDRTHHAAFRSASTSDAHAAALASTSP